MYDKNVEIPNAMLKFTTSEDEILDDGILTQSKEVFSLYNEYLEQIRSGELGKTAQSGWPTEFLKKFQNNSRTFQEHFHIFQEQIIGQN